ncbi:hypothetical protein KGZ04_30425, partial [Pseudomonas aeruginosa]|uniref:hypothetical protein n=1 Tax=Pseudomonas aeruginosa TaxID=287 RepID=UPI0023427124
AETLGLTELNGGALFDAEFGIGHGAAPYRKGQVLHSVFAAAHLNISSCVLLFVYGVSERRKDHAIIFNVKEY